MRNGERPPPDSWSRASNRTTVIIALLVLVHSTAVTWRIATSEPGIDFLTFWSVPHTSATWKGENIYSPVTQQAMAAALVAEVRPADTSDVERKAAALLIQTNGQHVDVTAPPLLYTLVGLTSSGNFVGDRDRFLAASLISLAASAIILCILLDFPAISTVLVVMFLVSWYAPVMSELRVANVNEIQLLMVALFVACSARGRPALAGAAITIATLLKPTTALVIVLSVIVGLVDRDSRRLVRELSGCAVAAVLAILVSSIYFGSVMPWLDFIRSLTATLAGGAYPVENGNFSLPALIFAATGWEPNATLLLVVLLAAFTWLVMATRRKPLVDDAAMLPAEAERARRTRDAFLIAGTGCAIMLFSSPLVWPHYPVLAIPLVVYLIRPTASAYDSATIRHVIGRLLPFVPLVLLSTLTLDVVGTTAVRESVMENAAVALMLGLAAHQLWRRRRLTLTGEATSH